MATVTNSPIPPTYTMPIIVDEKTGKQVFNPVWLQWFLDLARLMSNSGVTGNPDGGGTSGIDHNMLSNLQGGTTDEYYHLTAAEHAAIVVHGVTSVDDVLAINDLL